MQLLPDPAAEGFAPLVIGAENASTFKSMILPEFLSAARKGDYTFEAARQLRYQWEDEIAPRVDDGEKLALVPSDVTRASPPFSADNIRSEEDKKAAAKKILLNAQSRYWARRIVSFDFEYALLRRSRFSHKVSGSFSRVYPGALPGSGKTSQLFREKIRYLSPKYLEGFSWLTFRLFGNDDDILWVFSPVIRKVRHLTGSNRSDPIMNSALSIDDFLVWSGKAEMVEAVLDREVTSFVPFISLDSSCLKPAGSECFQPDFSGTSGWNYESKRFPDAPGWLAGGSVQVPRKLWKVDLTSKDPYSIYGRQSLYVDSETFLPAIKIVFDRSGHQMKTVIGIYGFAEADDKTRRLPFLAYMILEDVKLRDFYLMDYRNVTVCDSFPPGAQLSDFDPSKLGGDLAQAEPEAAPTAEAGPKKGKKKGN